MIGFSCLCLCFPLFLGEWLLVNVLPVEKYRGMRSKDGVDLKAVEFAG